MSFSFGLSFAVSCYIHIEGYCKLNGNSGRSSFEVPWVPPTSILVLDRRRGIDRIYITFQHLFHTGSWLP